MTDLRRNPSEVIEVANQSPVAILNHNRPTAYLISATAYEEMLEQLEDAALTKIVKARAGGQTIKVTLENL
jgi:antitoxin StbD